MAAVRSLFDILGFKFAFDKLSPFDRRSEMLGVEVDLRCLEEGDVVIDNKAARKEELAAATQQILSDGSSFLRSYHHSWVGYSLPICNLWEELESWLWRIFET